MRQGFRVIDTDTHVNPSMDVLLRYADQALQECVDELKPYMRTVKPRPGQGDAEDQETATMLTIKPLRYQRVAGEKPGTPTDSGGDRGFLSGRTHMVTRQPITARVSEDNSRGVCRIWTPRAVISTLLSPAPGPLALPPWPRTSPGASVVPITGI